MSAPIRILHVIGIMNLGGTENMIMNLYRRIDKNLIQFDFVENTDKPAAFDEEILAMGGRIYRCPHYNGKNHFTYTKWWKEFFKAHSNEYSVVHGHLGSTAAIYLSIAKKFGLYTVAHSHSTGGNFMYRLFAYPTRFIAHHFFACSKNAGISRYGKKVGNDDKRCTVLKNAIDVERFTYNESIRTKMRDSLNIPNETFVVGHVGQFRIEKNHTFLLDVFEKIHQNMPNSKLLLVGDGDLRSEIEGNIEKKQLTDSVILVGAKHNTNDYYQAMDALVFPSLYEGLGIVAIEAQAMGLPCCVSDTLPEEVIIEKDLIRFVSLNEAPEKWAEYVLASNTKNRKNVAENIRNKGYDIAQTSKWLQDFYIANSK